jgi:hypothetical protein
VSRHGILLAGRSAPGAVADVFVALAPVLATRPAMLVNSRPPISPSINTVVAVGAIFSMTPRVRRLVRLTPGPRQPHRLRSTADIGSSPDRHLCLVRAIVGDVVAPSHRLREVSSRSVNRRPRQNRVRTKPMPRSTPPFAKADNYKRSTRSEGVHSGHAPVSPAAWSQVRIG